MPIFIRGLAAVAGCLPLLAWPAEGSGPGPVPPFETHPHRELSSFVQRVVETNPRVLAARAAVEASRARESAAGRPLYNPELEADYEDAVDRTWEIGIGQTLDWAGKGKARSAVAASDRLAVEAEYLAVRWETEFELLTGLSRYQMAAQRDVLAVERQRVMQDFSDLAQQRLEAGDLNLVEADLATLAAIDAQIQRATAAATLAAARQAVRGLTPDTPVQQWPALGPDLPAAPDEDTAGLPALVMNLPGIRAAQRRLEVAEARVELRKREQRPDPTLSLRGGQEDDSTLVGINLSIPLYVRNSFKYEVAAAVAQRDQAQQVVDDMARRAHARLVSASERYRLSFTAWQSWQHAGRTSLERQGDLLRRMWQAGELSTTDYLVQLRQTLDTRESALDLELAMWAAWLEWLAASGQTDNWLGLEASS